MPKPPQYYIDRATSCERLADTAISPEAREIMLYLATRWRALAEKDEAKRRPPPTPERGL